MPRYSTFSRDARRQTLAALPGLPSRLSGQSTLKSSTPMKTICTESADTGRPVKSGKMFLHRAAYLSFKKQPCPFGFYGSVSKRCKCSLGQIEPYMSKISGPLVDRIDIHIDVPAITFSKLRSKTSQLDSDTMRQNVVTARDFQAKRFDNNKAMANARMSHKQVRKLCELGRPCEMMLKQAMTEFGLSARAHDKICKVVGTIADLDACENITSEHIAEVISYRKLDRRL